ncbi:MAG: hypothetical protein PHV43_01200 [Candidatus Colwellbacteria bacterium]|nr:hypothetical protein [Candidatus Colwellbacteria bacterium]
MVITICSSLKFWSEIIKLKPELEKLGHTVYMPIQVEGVDYWEEDGTKRIAAKRTQELISEHMSKIEKSEAILVANYTKKEINNYVGANTFLEIGFAHHLGKKIYFLNPIPDQPYIREELESVEPIILNGDLGKIS